MAKEEKTLFTESPSKTLKAGKDFKIADVDPESTPGYDGDKDAGEAELKENAKRFDELCEKMFANSRAETSKKKLLLVLQAMDTAGKGGIVSHVIGAVDPQLVGHHAFKAPTDEEKAHDFLWRIHKEVPEAGMLEVFDRSHYEEVLIHRVQGLSPLDVVEKRYDVINNFEQALAEDDTVIVKVMLNISKDEQKQRLTDRLDDPTKYWKFSSGDLVQREKWDEYQEAYEIAIQRTSKDDAPWYVVPANKKWYARLAVQQILIEALEGMGLEWPEPDFDLDEERKKVAAS